MKMLNTEHQNAACRALLANVVLLAVADACSQPPKRRTDERRPSLPISTEAFTAMRFLFDESFSGLTEYTTWLDIDPGQFRSRMLKIMHDSSPVSINGFDALQRRNFKFNYVHWFKSKNLDFSDLEETDD